MLREGGGCWRTRKASADLSIFRSLRCVSPAAQRGTFNLVTPLQLGGAVRLPFPGKFGGLWMVVCGGVLRWLLQAQLFAVVIGEIISGLELG
ncbi:MAG: hypothetical protein DWG81_04420 [Chloroflexi bacterium]|nr:hypothetical protein [Chloroflexota bacterium]